MKVEKREAGITLVPETEFERETLNWMRKEIVERMHFENEWDCKGKFYIDFATDWGK